MCCDQNGSCTFKMKHFICSFLSLSVCLLAIVLLSVSVNYKVQQDEFAVAYNNYSKQFGKIYEQGIYAINVGDQLIKFKRTLQDIDISQIDCITQDKIEIRLSISAQYQLNKNDLIPFILLKFNGNDNYNAFISNIVSNVILRQCGLDIAENYYTDRSIIYNKMYDALINEINFSNQSYGSTIEFFQLNNIEFPTTFQNAISSKQVLMQQQITELNNRQSKLIQANTTLFQNQRIGNVMIINATNQANIIINQANITYEIIQNEWKQRAMSYKSIMDNLKLNQSQLLDYLRADVIRGAESPVISV
jgi:hypothetical protein